MDVCSGSFVSVGEGEREGGCEGYEPMLDVLGVGGVSEGLLFPAGGDDDGGGAGGAGEYDDDDDDGAGEGEGEEGGDNGNDDGAGEDDEDMGRSPASGVLEGMGEVVSPLGWVDELKV